MSGENEQLVELLHEVNRGVFDYLRKSIETREIPFALMIFMKEVAHEPGITLSELARRTVMAKSHVSSMVEQAIALGWMEKRKDPTDQRIVRLYVSESALKQWGGVRESMRQKLADLVADFPQDKTEELVNGLLALKAVLGRARKQGRQEANL